MLHNYLSLRYIYDEFSSNYVVMYDIKYSNGINIEGSVTVKEIKVADVINAIYSDVKSKMENLLKEFSNG